MKRIKRGLTTVRSSDPEKCKTINATKGQRLAQIGRSGTVGDQAQSPILNDDRRRSSSVAYLETTRPRFLDLSPTNQQYVSPNSLAPARSSTALDKEMGSSWTSLHQLTADIQQHYHWIPTPEVASRSSSCYVDEDSLVYETQKRIMRAKAEGRTVSAVDGCLYIDYKYVGRLPNGCIV